jgi:superfamily I DNA/RNA helicase
MLTTYHSAKGLDFDKVFIPFIDDFEHFNGGDNWTEDDDKKLFMVALTRSRKDLILSYTNHLNSYVKKFADKCLHKEL